MKLKDNQLTGHILALFTATVWGLTLISTKILLKDFQPVEILFFRFILAIFLLSVIYPHKMPKTTKKQEFLIALAGLFGICFYYLLENIALTYTLAANVGVISCCSPLFVIIFSVIFMKKKFGVRFFIGFISAIVGISLISFNGAKIHLNPLGDFFALTGAVVWATYSILIKKISGFGFSTILVTRKTFIYGIIFMFPILFIFNFRLGPERFLDPVNLKNILFLGFLASAICFATWSKAIKILGAVKGSVYIYFIPVITVIFSSLILREPITDLLLLGTFLTLLGLIISETGKKK